MAGKVELSVVAKNQASSVLKQVGSDIRGLGTEAGKAKGGLSDMFNVAGGQLIASGISAVTRGLVDLSGQALATYADYERLTMSLETFSAKELINAGVTNDMATAIGLSGEHAQELLSWIEKLAIESPFQTKDIASAFRTAQAYGFAGDQAQRLTQATVDFAAGAGISGAMMDRITLALGQIAARGKVSSQELNQLSETGINARQILANAFGVSTAQIQEMIEKGLVPADLAIEALTQSLEKDFGGAAKRQANTFSGLISSLSDLKEIGLREFFTGTFKAVQPLLQNFVGYVTDPAVKESLRAWGDILGEYVAGKLEYVGELFNIVTQTATAGGGLFAALGSLTGGEVQITAEGLITSVDWGDFVGVLDWQNYVASLTWGDFVSTFAWADAVTSLAWGDFILAFDWDDWIGTFAWGDFVSIVNWADWVYTLSWGDFLINLDWGNFVFGFQWGDYVYQLGWADFVGLFEWTDYAVGLNWGDFVGSFNWVDKVAAITWGDFIGVFSWEKWIAQIKWGDYVGRFAWSDFVDGITWENYVLALNWGDFLAVFDWDNYVATLVWGDFMSSADWGNWIYTLTWGDYVAQVDWGNWIISIAWGDYVFQLDWSAYLPAFTAWTDYISKLTWSDVVTAFDGWSTYISTLTWTDIIITALDWATWIPALAWNEFVRVIDWVTWIVPLAWNAYINNFSWDDFVDGALDWTTYVSSLDWGSYISSALEWSSYVASVTWGNFVEKLEWPNFVTGIDFTSWVPSFPGWDYFFSWFSGGDTGNSPSFRSSGSIGGNAMGTDSWRGGWTWVGEKGPELLNLPKGSQILSSTESQKMIGQLADGTTTASNPWPVQSARPDLALAKQIGASFAGTGEKVGKAFKQAMKDLENSLKKVPGLFGASPVTEQQKRLGELGVPQNFADDYLRRLTDEVVNGVDWENVDIGDAAARAGIDPSLPAEAILELFKQKWNDSSLFADPKNKELINMDAVEESLKQQAQAKLGQANLLSWFGVTPEVLTAQSSAAGGSIGTGIASGASTALSASTVGTDLAGGLSTAVKPEMLAPVGGTIVDGIVTEIVKKQHVDRLGAALIKMFTTYLGNPKSFTAVGEGIIRSIAAQFGATKIDMVAKLMATIRTQLGTEAGIAALAAVGEKILDGVYKGYVGAAKNADWTAGVSGTKPEGGTTTTTTPTVVTPVTTAPGNLTPRSLALAGAGGGGNIYITNYFTVNNAMDVQEVAAKVVDVIRRRR